MEMLTDEDFRKTPKCSFYSNMLSNKKYEIFMAPVHSKELVNDMITSGFSTPGKTWSLPFLSLSKSNFINDVAKVLIAKDVDIGITIPENLNLWDVCDMIGRKHPVKMIEVGTQSEIGGYTFEDYITYLTKRSSNHKILNLISLEFSKTPLASKIHAPSLVRTIDWIDLIWPLNRRAKGDYPQVQKYCLCGMAGSYTDFHIDFGGTSVWYHVVYGRKRFYVIEPTIEHLQVYKEWSSSPQQESVFLGDLVSKCYQIDICPGQTFMIPSGWIHSVYTPEDSLVFGGNFLHSHSILHQLQVDQIEVRTNVAQQYRFPYFQQLNWYTIVYLLPYALEKHIHILLNQEVMNTLGVQLSPQDMDLIYSIKKMTEDSDDYDETHNELCDTLFTLPVLSQLPYLLKSLELWLHLPPIYKLYELPYITKEVKTKYLNLNPSYELKLIYKNHKVDPVFATIAQSIFTSPPPESRNSSPNSSPLRPYSCQMTSNAITDTLYLWWLLLYTHILSTPTNLHTAGSVSTSQQEALPHLFHQFYFADDYNWLEKKYDLPSLLTNKSDISNVNTRIQDDDKSSALLPTTSMSHYPAETYIDMMNKNISDFMSHLTQSNTNTTNTCISHDNKKELSIETSTDRNSSDNNTNTNTNTTLSRRDMLPNIFPLSVLNTQPYSNPSIDNIYESKSILSSNNSNNSNNDNDNTNKNINTNEDTSTLKLKFKLKLSSSHYITTTEKFHNEPTCSTNKERNGSADITTIAPTLKDDDNDEGISVLNNNNMQPTKTENNTIFKRLKLSLKPESTSVNIIDNIVPHNVTSSLPPNVSNNVISENHIIAHITSAPNTANTATGKSTTTTTTHKHISLHPVNFILDNNNDNKKEEDGKLYHTRGHRLSADFLRQVADVEVDDLPTVTTTASALSPLYTHTCTMQSADKDSTANMLVEDMNNKSTHRQRMNDSQQHYDDHYTDSDNYEDDMDDMEDHEQDDFSGDEADSKQIKTMKRLKKRGKPVTQESPNTTQMKRTKISSSGSTSSSTTTSMLHKKKNSGGGRGTHSSLSIRQNLMKKLMSKR